MLILLFFAFLAGLVTILAPCIWPLLPIVLSASASGGRKKPLGITLGVATSFTIFTLFISYLIKIFHLDPNALRLLAVVILGLLGLALLWPSFGAKLESAIGRVLGPLQNRFKGNGDGFSAGYVSGFSLGILWAPCAGPIFGTIAALAATQEINAEVILITLAYVAGVAIPLFFFSCAGAWLFRKMRAFNKYTGRVQQAFGVLMILSALLIYSNYDKVIQVKLLNVFPSYGNFLYRFEKSDTVQKELGRLRGETPIVAPAGAQQEAFLPVLGPAPAITGITSWINSEALTMEQLRGKVVLIDFWTYSCINCVRTLPYVTGWYEQYKDQGFMVVGVHAPEFAFEKSRTNVERAVKQFNIHYPVALDNDFGTWRAFNNHYWPAKYLIDAQGRVRKTHFGEGNYEEMENAIRELLTENGKTLSAGLQQENAAPALSGDRTPETYLGFSRLERFESPEQVVSGVQQFTSPPTLPPDHFAYEGAWTITNESGIAGPGAALLLHFKADKVFLVLSPKTAGDRIKIFLDGEPAGEVILDEERLYELIDLKGNAGDHLLRLEFPNEGVNVYAFTFG